MATATFKQPDRTDDTGSEYPLHIDAAIKVLANMAAQFAPHEASTPDMTVVLDAGKLQVHNSIVEQGQQITGTITAPTTQDRRDLIAISLTDGTVSVVSGTEGATPTLPALTEGTMAIAEVYLTPSHTEITNADITDLRTSYFFSPGGNITGFVKSETIYTDVNGDSQGGDIFDIPTEIGGMIEPGWFSIGPMGSGADYEWSALDVLPANTTSIVLQAYGAQNGLSNTLTLSIRRNGSSAAAANTKILELDYDISQKRSDMNTKPIPVDANNMFEIFWDWTHPDGQTGECTLELVEFRV